MVGSKEAGRMRSAFLVYAGRYKQNEEQKDIQSIAVYVTIFNNTGVFLWVSGQEFDTNGYRNTWGSRNGISSRGHKSNSRWS